DRTHLQMADRRPRHRQVLVLRPALGARQALLRGACRRGLPADELAPRPPSLRCPISPGSPRWPSRWTVAAMRRARCWCAAATRPLAEETGVTALRRAYLDNIDVIERGADGALRFHFLLAAVLCEHVAGDPVAADDALDARWVSVGDILDGRLPLSAGVAAVI